jgi:WD repeat-containing protein 70
LKFHDFAGMVPNTLRAFKSVDPTATKSLTTGETHPIHTVKFNPNSPSQVLVVSATPQARILSRDGESMTEFVKGDMYLRDMNMTKGHISEITCGTWHPNNYDLCVTAGTDSTLRIWDVNFPNKQKDVIVHKSKAPGSAGRSRLTAVAWGSQIDSSHDILVTSALDGSLMLYSGNGPFARPSSEVNSAHQPDTWTSGIDISPDGRLVVTRGGDDTIKLWDTRKFKLPVSTTTHPSTSSQYPTSSITFAPNTSSILTGSATGDLHILNPATLRPNLITPITPSNPLITLTWHPTLNQIATGSADGSTHLLFSPTKSNKAALLILSKPPKRRHFDDDPSLTTDLSGGIPIADPDATSNPTTTSSSNPKLGLTASGKSRDPRRPFLPTVTPFSKNAPDEEAIRKNIPLSSMREEDPREALLKYAEKAETDRMFTNAWRETQPKTIYADVDEEEDAEAERARKRLKQK